uniref:HP domain-containing protein n=1 Tax=Panagrolaimus sp. JU765 TaxID=591449 RepID=A0AC34Q0M1_9BILA
RYISTDKTGRNEDNTTMLVVKQGFEPLSFKAHFGVWDDDLWNNEMSYEQLRDLISVKVDLATTTPEPIQTVQNLVQEFDKLYSIDVLRLPTKELPFGIDPVNKERHLSDTDFQQVFNMTRENFTKLPKWRQLDHKKRAGLF